MLTPPAVRWVVGVSHVHRCAVLAIALVLLALNGACSWGAALLEHIALMWFFSLLALLFAIRGLYKSPSGILCWSGVRWTWEGFPDNAPTQVECVLALPRFVLVRVCAEQCPVTWLWLTPGATDDGWSALRRALVFAHSQYTPSTGLASVK